jgi:thymidylate synthase
MKEIFIKGKTLTDGYHQALVALEKEGSVIGCSDWNQKQKECAMTIWIENPLREPRISKLIIGGPYDLQRYVMEIVDGIMNFKIGQNWDYTYNARFEKYYNFVVDELKRNSETRRAIISIRDNEADSKTSNPACLQSIQFFIRDNKLDQMVLFRSNDLPEAFFFNAFAFIKLQEKIAKELGIEVGTYTHRSNSMHCYEKDFKLLEGCVKAINEKSAEDNTYSYEDEWEEMMNEEIPNIMKLVEGLK